MSKLMYEYHRILLIPALVIAFVLLYFVPCAKANQFEYSEGFEYKEYLVKPGDTLWSISKRELEDGFQWPLIWRENLKINNPDAISPGQIIIIPVRVVTTKRPVAPESVVVIEGGEAEDVSKFVLPPADEAPPEMIANVPDEVAREVKSNKVESRDLEPLVGRSLLLSAGYITKVVPNVGEITGNPYGRMTFGDQDEIYIQTKTRARVGQKYYVVKNMAEVRHPEYRYRVGWLIKVAGVVETIEAGTRGLKARVLESFDDMGVGDTLDHYYDVSAPFIVGEPRRPQVSGYVIASNYMRMINGSYDVIFLDKGQNTGLRLGDVLMTLYEGTDDKMSAIVQVVNIRKETSLGLILKSDAEVKRGDKFQGIR